MIRTPLIAILLFAASLAAATPEQEVRDVEKAWSTAVVAGDTATLDRVLAPDLFYGHASGAHDNKQTYIDRIKSGAQKYASFKYDEQPPEVRIYGGTAVLIASAQIDSVTDGTPNSQHLRFLHVYVRHGRQWRLVAHQSVKLAK